MRMWLVKPELMCRKHLLGEHVEMHMCIGSIKRKKSLKGFLDDGLIDPSLIIPRHDELVQEMQRRGYKHKSPLVKHDNIKDYGKGNVDVVNNIKELANRCSDCKNLQEGINASI